MPTDILSTEQRRNLIGDDDAPGILDEYKILVIEANDGKTPLIVWHCPRQHGAVTGHMGVIARDLDGDQTGLTLGELVSAALEHEIEDH